MTYNNNIRSKIINIRNNINNDIIINKSNEFYNYIINHKKYKDNKIIYLYNSIKNELNTKKLINYCLKDNKIVCLPICINNTLVFQKIDNNTVYITNKYKIKEPEFNKNDIINDKGFMIIPVISSYNNYRLGYGKGYYDRYLKDKNFIYTLGVGYDFQNIPFEINKSDIRLGEIKLF